MVYNKETQKRYYELHKEEILVKARIYHSKKQLTDKEYRKHRAIKTKEWIDNNREQFNLRMREYAHRNRLKCNARKMALIKITIPKNILCCVCSNNIATERDHRDYSKPLKVLFVCKQCNENLDHKQIKMSLIGE